MTCESCGCILSRFRDEDEPEGLCHPCANASVVLEAAYDCPLCHQSCCDCMDEDDDGFEDCSRLDEADLKRMARAHHAEPCKCERPMIERHPEGNACLCGRWID